MDEKHELEPSVQEDKKGGSRLIFRVILCALILVVGIMGMQWLTGLKKPPAEVVRTERRIRVSTVKVRPENVQVMLTGYGEVKPVTVVGIAAEASGRVVEVHERLRAGETMKRGDLLLAVDDTNYRSNRDQALALVIQQENTIIRLQKELSGAERRLVTLKRSRDLAEGDFRRVEKLYTQNQIGSKSGVDAAERAYNQVVDQVDQLIQATEIYPISIKEANQALAAARARLTLAEADLDRCRVIAPFDGRIKQANIEIGQFVTPGNPLITLADDSVLELQVPIDSTEARKWLVFVESSKETAWFGRLEPLSCTIRWTEDPEGHVWNGILHRIVSFNRQTRTVTVAVRALPSAQQPRNALPLVEGMFCAVEIPGKNMQNVFRVPRWAVSFRNTVYAAQDGRLKTIPVSVARIQGEEALIESGLTSGDALIVTRLVDPLENTLLEIQASTPITDFNTKENH